MCVSLHANSRQSKVAGVPEPAEWSWGAEYQLDISSLGVGQICWTTSGIPWVRVGENQVALRSV